MVAANRRESAEILALKLVERRDTGHSRRGHRPKGYLRPVYSKLSGDAIAANCRGKAAVSGEVGLGSGHVNRIYAADGDDPPFADHRSCRGKRCCGNESGEQEGDECENPHGDLREKNLGRAETTSASVQR